MCVGASREKRNFKVKNAIFKVKNAISKTCFRTPFGFTKNIQIWLRADSSERRKKMAISRFFPSRTPCGEPHCC